jgi:hypothetical protein
MGIYKRGNVYWIDYYDSNRRRVQESSQSSIRREAEKLLTIRKSEILRGIYKQPIEISLGEFGSRYMERPISGLGYGTNRCLITLMRFSARRSRWRK